MTVHGLVHDMTVKAAQEAALGAGANLKLITASLLSDFDIKRLKALKPNIIMIAGGVDYGEAKTSLANSETISSLKLNTPVVYAGNSAVRDEVREIFRKHGQEEFLFVTENVYPKIDSLNVEPARKIIHLFENISPRRRGWKSRNRLRKIIPLGAVMKAALHKTLGDLVCVDVGGPRPTCSVSKSRKHTDLLSAPGLRETDVEGDWASS